MTPPIMQYLSTALWASTDDDGEPLDRRFSIWDIAPESLAEVESEWSKFEAEYGQYFTSEHCLNYGPDCTDIIERAAHDFFLTRNRHGAGFWDGDWAEPAASILTEASRKLGESDPYVGDDGLIYFFPH